MNLLLTTYPAHRSLNVGDSLITNSAIDLITARYRNYAPEVLFRQTDLDSLIERKIASIVAPGFSVSEGVYRGTYPLFSDLGCLSSFFPIGCSFQQPLQTEASFLEFKYSNQTADFLACLAEKFGPYPCRDAMIVEILEKNGIPAVYCGDLALYDEGMLNRCFTPPDSVQSAVFTIGHHPKYVVQSLQVLELMRSTLPEAQLFVSFHSKPTEHALTIAQHAFKLGFAELRPYGSSRNLSCYDQIDIHVGYRLHGHIFFLRKKKPSILLGEDVRSYGVWRTPGINTGCFLAFLPQTLAADADAPHRAIEFLKHQMSDRFRIYQDCFASIERTYHEIIAPYFNNLCRHLSIVDTRPSIQPLASHV